MKRITLISEDTEDLDKSSLIGSFMSKWVEELTKTIDETIIKELTEQCKSKQ